MSTHGANVIRDDVLYLNSFGIKIQDYFKSGASPITYAASHFVRVFEYTRIPIILPDLQTMT